MSNMSRPSLPWSFYAVLISFGVFFFSLNVYILTKLLSHPLETDLYLIGIVGGFVALLYSVHMVRVHQQELIEAKRKRDAELRRVTEDRTKQQ
ncbi:MAG: hypothetical protein ACTSPX_06475 [Candidatus Thorarchaeota archaeon]